MKKIRKIISALAIFAFIASIAGCSLSLSENEGGKEKIEYGSITIKGGNSEGDSRALDVSTITSATVTVSGYGMSDITKTNVSIAAGQGNATIENIPTGPNRVVTVESNVTGVTIRAVCNIVQGNENSVTVNWNSTAVANVYYYLIKKSVNVTSIESSLFSSKIPDVHASLFDAESFAEDFNTASLDASGLTSSDYVLDYGTISVTSSKASGYTLQITDIASEKKTIASDGESFELKAYPGTWKAWVLDSTGTKVAEKDITVVSGEVSTVDVTYSEGGEITDKIVVYSAKTLGYLNMYVWNTTNDSINQTHINMTESGDDYYGEIEATSCSIIMTKAASAWTGQTGNLSIASAGAWRFNGSSFVEEEVSTEPTVTLTVNSAPDPTAGVKIYVSASSAPKIWVWQPSGLECTKLMGYTWNSQPTMEAATDLIYNAGWYVLSIPEDCYTADKAFSFILNSGETETSTKTTTFWYDAAALVGSANAYYDSDPTTVPEPVEPTLEITPASGKEIGTSASIKIKASFGYDTPTVKTVTINGTTHTLSEGVNTFPVSDYATEVGVTITVNATLTNSVGTATIDNATYTTKVTAEDPFTWDNVNAYFVLTDRFYNGDTSNDHSYSRSNNSSNSSVPDVATFHGGDIAGLTAKLDYFDSLGVNAIWITAPYEQVHGWVGGKNNAFPHYAYHGYYTLDWTSMDQNMGTLEELRTFVNACHSKGIRVIMDVVMNHVGYNNTADMVTYSYGYTEHTADWIGTTDGLWVANDTVLWDNSYWDTSWFGPWIRSFGYESGSEYGGSCGGLPDVKTELEESVGMAPVLSTKWNLDSNSVKSNYWNPSVANADWNGYSGDYRTDKGIAPADYQVVWLSAWVRELGIDGFRCDTAKHVEEWRWGQLQEACQAALEVWRSDSTKDKTYNGADTGAADWDESFWMTAEYFGWNKDGSMALSGSYYSTGCFDSMINFQFNGSQWGGSGSSGSTPSTDNWSTYANAINSNQADTNGNGNRNNFLSYISSHDTGLHRPSDMYAVGTMFVLLPGGVQIYYGDESNRPAAYTDCGDTDMMTRGDMNWDNDSLVAHWGKVGNFRKYNPAVGAGVQTVSGSTYVRSYSGSAGESKVAISISGTSVDVSGLWEDGTTVYNWYDGTSATVSGGSVTFAGGTTSQPILVSDKNPATYGITF